MAAPVIQFKKGQFANLPGLRKGEPGFTTDFYDLYIGINSTTSGNKFFGSHRYWKRETTTSGSGIRLVEGTNNGSGDITIQAPGSISGLTTYTMPTSGYLNQFLKISSIQSIKNGNLDCTLGFADVITDVVGDTSPQLGGDLDLNSNDITGTGNLNVTGIVTATTFSGSGASLTNIPNAALNNSTVSYGGVQLSLGGSDATPAFDLSDATNYPTSSLSGTITNAQLAGSIDNSKLSNSTVSYGGVQLSLGGSDATPAFDLSDATNYPFTSLTGIATDIVGDTSPQLGGDLDLNGNDITGTGNLNIGGNATVTGNLTVNGTTTQLNTTSTTVEDVLLELQVINGSAPSSDTNKDVGIVMNYFLDSAKKAALYWDDSLGRIVAADDVSESNGVLTPSTYAAFEIGSLYLNDCAGASQVISCSGTTRSLENITIDAGTF